MDQFIFSIYDSAAEAYLPPFFVPTKAIAVRNFQHACNDETHAFHRHAGDYTLFELGTFNQKTAEITTHATPENHGLALTFIEAK